MTQNMFQEGLYHVFFKEKPSTRLQAQATIHGELDNVRIHRWFGTVVNTRLLVTGVVQVLSALVCILTTVTHACVSYNCSVSMTTPVWSSLFYLAAGSLAMEVQRKANKPKLSVWILCSPGQQSHFETSCCAQHKPTACRLICCEGQFCSIQCSVFSVINLHTLPVLERPASLQCSSRSGLQPALAGSG
nr:PREDICTED: uncharacterized protein LOC109624244 isoform X2 [Paralichthys olivaceus]